MTQNIEMEQEKNLFAKTVTTVTEFGWDTVYMGLGVVGKGKDVAGDLWEKGLEYRQSLIERGEMMFDKNRERVNDLVDNPREVVQDSVKKAGDQFERYSQQVLTRVNLPTAVDVEAMTKKVNAIDRKLDKIIKENAAAQQI